MSTATLTRLPCTCAPGQRFFQATCPACRTWARGYVLLSGQHLVTRNAWLRWCATDRLAAPPLVAMPEPPPPPTPQPTRVNPFPGTDLQPIPADAPAWCHTMRRVRLAQKYSLKQLARRTGIPHNTLGTWERGLARPRRPALLARVAAALGTDVADWGVEEETLCP